MEFLSAVYHDDKGARPEPLGYTRRRECYAYEMDINGELLT